MNPPCKVCDQGILISKRIFRMSRPVVAIGYILLIPSILGMTASALMFFGVTTYKSNPTNDRPQPVEEPFNIAFRNGCAANFDQTYRQALSSSAPTLLVAEYCECALNEIKQGNSDATAKELCLERWSGDKFIAPPQKTQDLYARIINNPGRPPEPQSESANNLVRAIGGTFAIFLFIASFVGGLLGWLLVMKKRVLKCSVCGAVVNAS
jgi:hypothetical protein